MSNEPDLDDLVEEWLTVPDVAERLEIPITRVHALISDFHLASHRRGERSVKSIPALFLDGNNILDPLRGTLSVLHDAGYNEQEAIRWLFTPDESLPGRPIDALHAGRKTEVRRRAQASAW